MKFFELKNSIDIKEVGKTPQSEEGYMGDVQQEFIPFEGIIDFDFKLPEPKLVDKAKATSYLDVIITSSRFLVIDDKLLKFFRNFNIGNYQSWKIKVWQKNKLIENYNLFFLNEIRQTDYIDYKRSRFYKGKFFSNNREDTVEITSYSDFLHKRENIKNQDNLHLLEDKIVFNLKNVEEDLFKIMNSPRSGYYVSERLKKAIEENGFTGMDFQEIESIKNVEVLY